MKAFAQCCLGGIGTQWVIERRKTKALCVKALLWHGQLREIRGSLILLTMSVSALTAVNPV
jgi:hypothetical protein